MTTNRIDETFRRLRAAGQVGVFPYLTMGFPELDATEGLALAMLEAGADGLELGVPFSDPVMDGVTLQRASQQALSNGASMRWTLEVASRIRARSEAPLFAMTSFNPVHRYGMEDLVKDGVAAGLDGFIVPDLPLGESGPLLESCGRLGLHLIQLVAPTTTDERLEAVGRVASGFIYCVSLLGTTGARVELSDRLPTLLNRVRLHTDRPLMVGFGISRPEHVAGLKGMADACAVGGAVADLIEHSDAKDREGALASYVKSLKAAG